LAHTAEYWIKKLGLVPHVEGGYFAPAYRSPLRLSADCLPGFSGGERIPVSSIYYLLRKGQFSAFHRLKSTEIWHFYAGGPLSIYILEPGGGLREIRLGTDAEGGESFQAVIEPGHWFGAAPHPDTDFCLVGCTVAPGFEDDDFELAVRDELLEAFPRHGDIIQRLAKP